MGHWNECRTEIGLFQVKYHWRNCAVPEVIAFSAGMLMEIARRYERVAMNFPGIGLGGLRPRDIEPILEPLPSHVHIYSYPVL